MDDDPTSWLGDPVSAHHTGAGSVFLSAPPQERDVMVISLVERLSRWSWNFVAAVRGDQLTVASVAAATLPTRADEAGGPPPTKFYELRDNLLVDAPTIEDPGFQATTFVRVNLAGARNLRKGLDAAIAQLEEHQAQT